MAEQVREWTAQEKIDLEAMWEDGLADRQIGARLNRSHLAVRSMRNLLALVKRDKRLLYHPENNITFPQFENITKQEARAILATAPPSARITHQTARSLTGNSSTMCAS